MQANCLQIFQEKTYFVNNYVHLLGKFYFCGNSRYFSTIFQIRCCTCTFPFELLVTKNEVFSTDRGISVVILLAFLECFPNESISTSLDSFCIQSTIIFDVMNIHPLLVSGVLAESNNIKRGAKYQKIGFFFGNFSNRFCILGSSSCCQQSW